MPHQSQKTESSGSVARLLKLVLLVLLLVLMAKQLFGVAALAELVWVLRPRVQHEHARAQTDSTRETGWWAAGSRSGPPSRAHAPSFRTVHRFSPQNERVCPRPAASLLGAATRHWAASAEEQRGQQRMGGRDRRVTGAAETNQGAQMKALAEQRGQGQERAKAWTRQSRELQVCAL